MTKKYKNIIEQLIDGDNIERDEIRERHCYDTICSLSKELNQNEKAAVGAATMNHG